MNTNHRRSIRLKGYEYAQRGAYFVSIVTKDRFCLFGEVVEGEMIWNNAGRMVEKCWLQIPVHFPNMQLSEDVIMPNHLHRIVEIVGANPEGLVEDNNHLPKEKKDVLDKRAKTERRELTEGK